MKHIPIFLLSGESLTLCFVKEGAGNEPSSPSGVAEPSSLAERRPLHITIPEKCHSAVKNESETSTGDQLLLHRKVCSWKHSPIAAAGEGKGMN